MHPPAADLGANTVNGSLAKTLGEINGKLDTLTRVVGEESVDGKSGTGLFGEVRRATQEVTALKSLRDRGLGLVLGVLILAAVLGLGIKQAASSLLAVLK